LKPTGRFAPTPSGPLHFGSVVAAAGSFLAARSRGGRWLLRIDDLDAPRNVPGATDAILSDLERLGLEWDGALLHQLQRHEAYAQALARLEADGWSYPCACSRREVRSGPYRGTCRDGVPAGREARSVRVRTDGPAVVLDDRLAGPHAQDVQRAVGDFVVRRADGIFAYHLATVIDDAWQGVDEVVRGGDLLGVTPRQIHLQRCLGLPTPAYTHLPTAVGRDGHKLSKQNHAAPIAHHAPETVVACALEYLGHPPPGDLRRAPPREQWTWAIARWDLARVPREAQRPSPL
jgi:glutamyl-Q tRNA(Asp) synthetase